MQTPEEILLKWHQVYLTAYLPAASLLQGAPTNDQIHALRWKKHSPRPRSTENVTFPRQFMPPNLWHSSWRCSHLEQCLSQPMWSFKLLNYAGSANPGLRHWAPFLMQRLVSLLEFPRELLSLVWMDACPALAFPTPKRGVKCCEKCQAPSSVSGHVWGIKLQMPCEDREHFCGKLPSSPELFTSWVTSRLWNASNALQCCGSSRAILSECSTDVI